jgi:polyhydroxyalkanoate synthase subunit PhaC
MTSPDSAGIISPLVRETERTAIRARHGLRFLTGAEWAPVRPTPSDLVWSQGHRAAVALPQRSGPLRRTGHHVHRPVSRSYILDLHRQNSVARRLRDAGLDVYLMDWGIPTSADSQNMLETYVRRYLPRALRVALAELRAEQASFPGYCMDGNLGLLALAGQTLPVRILVTMATPVDFTALPGLAEALLERQIDPDRLIDWTGNVPAEYLFALFRMRRPTADVPNMARLWENLWNDEFVESHQAMARWSREHVPFPGAAFRQVADQWLRHNGFRTNSLRLAGRAVDLKDVRCPMFSIIALRDDLIPPAAARSIGLIWSARRSSSC